MRLVLDTCVVVAAFRSRNGASFKVLQLLVEGGYTAIATPALFLEYESVLRRQEQREVQDLSAVRLEDAISGLAALLEAVQVDFQWKPQLTDPNDEMVLEAALNGRAYAIITHNVRDFLPAAHDFGLRVMTPGAIIKERFDQ